MKPISKGQVITDAKANAESASGRERPSGVGGEAQTSLQLHVKKIKTEELASSDCPLSRPAAVLSPGICSIKSPRLRAPRANYLPRKDGN